MISIINDMERIGDICYQMSIEIERKNEKKIKFDQNLKKNILELTNAVNDALNVMQKNLQENYNQVSISKADELEISINKIRNKLRKKYLQEIEKGSMEITEGMIYINLVHSLEKIGDHIFNVSEAITGD